MPPWPRRGRDAAQQADPPPFSAGRRARRERVGWRIIASLTADGSVWSWGHVAWGQLGHGDAQEQWQPKKLEAFAGQRVVAASVGGSHSLATTADGALWSWGGGAFGMLGHGDQQRQLLPKKRPSLG